MNAVIQFGGHPVVHRLGWTLLHFVWQGAVIAGLFAGAQICQGKRSSNARYWMGCLALAMMLAAPVVTFFVLGTERTIPPVVAGGNAGDVNNFSVLPGIYRRDGVDVEGGQAGQHYVADGNGGRLLDGGGHRPPLQGAGMVARSETFVRVFVLVWLLGVSALSLRLLTGSLQVALWKRRGNEPLDAPWLEQLERLKGALQISRPVRLVRSVLVQVPTVVGWLRPVILLPAASLTGLTPAQLESILAHELAHIRRHDYLVNLLQNALETLLFYHPAVWWVSSCVRAEREICCDEIAVELCGDRLVYAQALTTLEQLRGGAPSLALGADGGSLLDRIRRLSGAPTDGSLPGRRRAGGVLVAAAVAVIFVALLHHPLSDAKAQATSTSDLKQTNEIVAGAAAQANVDGGTAEVHIPEWLSVEIRCATNVFKVGDEIPVEFILSNHGKGDYDYWRDRPNQRMNEFELSAKTAAGEAVPDPLGQFAPPGFGGGAPYGLGPGDSTSKTIFLNSWASIKKAGKYEVTGTYRLADFFGVPRGDHVRAVPIEITVLPRTKEEMGDYVKSLTDQIAGRLAVLPHTLEELRDFIRAGKVVQGMRMVFFTGDNEATQLSDDVLHDLVLKLGYTGHPAAVPTLLSFLSNKAGPAAANELLWAGNALLFYFPHTEEIAKAIGEEASRNGTNYYLEELQRNYDAALKRDKVDPVRNPSPGNTNGAGTPPAAIIHANADSAAGNSSTPADAKQTNEIAANNSDASTPFGKKSDITLQICCTNPVFAAGDEVYVQFIFTNHGSRDFAFLPSGSSKHPLEEECLIFNQPGVGESVPAQPTIMHPFFGNAGLVGPDPNTRILHGGESFTNTVPLRREEEVDSGLGPGPRAKKRRAVSFQPGRYEIVGAYIPDGGYPSADGVLRNSALWTSEAITITVLPEPDNLKPAEKPTSSSFSNTNAGGMLSGTTRQTRANASAANDSTKATNSPGLSLVIRCVSNDFKIGDEIPVEFVVSNRGTNDYEYDDRAAEWTGLMSGFKLAAKSSTGESIPDPSARLEPYYNSAQNYAHNHLPTLPFSVLHPGESLSRTVPLNRRALIREAGRYEVVGTYSSGHGFAVSEPISVNVLPRTAEEMGDYVRDLTNQVTWLLANTPGKQPGPVRNPASDFERALADEEHRSLTLPWNSALRTLVIKLAYTGDPAIVPTLLRTMYEANTLDGSDIDWEGEALLSYVPHSEEIKKEILQAAAEHGLNTSMHEVVSDYGFNQEELTPIVARALAADNAGEWDDGALLAAFKCYDDAFTPRLIAIANDTNVIYYVRGFAIDALAWNRTDAGVQALKTLMKEPDSGIWEFLATGLFGGYGGGYNGPQPSPSGRHLRTEDFGAEEMRPFIARLLASSVPSTQNWGVNLLTIFGDDAFTPKLIALAMDGTGDYAAMCALAMNRSDEGVRTLKMLLNSPDPNISRRAEQAVRYAYTKHGNARGRALRADDFDVRLQRGEAVPEKHGIGKGDYDRVQ